MLGCFHYSRRIALELGEQFDREDGEPYDFEFESDAPGAIPLRGENTLNNAQLLARIIEQ